jgi:transposase
MHSSEKRRRRRHSPAFRAASVAACLEPGASVAAVALERQLNANLLRKWVQKARTGSALANVMARTEAYRAAPAFMPLPLETRRESAPTSAERPIRVQIRKARSRITVEWPTTSAGACAAWLRELLG